MSHAGPQAGGTRPQDGGRRRRLAGVLSGILLGLLALFLIAQLLHFGHAKDQAVFSLIGGTILEGGAPYGDAWDIKPPGIYFVYALAHALFGPGFGAVRLLEALGLASLFAAFFLYARRHVGSTRAGLLGATLSLLAYVPFEFWHTAQPEGFAGVVLAWALVCVSYDPGAPGAGGGGGCSPLGGPPARSTRALRSSSRRSGAACSRAR